MSYLMSDLIELHLAAVKTRISARTYGVREQLLRRLDRELPKGIERATETELQAWLAAGQDRGCAQKTLETYWTHIVAFYHQLTRGRRPHLDYDPSVELVRPKVGKHDPRVARDDVLAHALANLRDPDYLLAVVLASGLGMRAAEVADANREDFTSDGSWVLIRGKGDKERSVPVPPDVWYLVRERPAGRLITNHCEPVTPLWISARVSHALTAIGLPRVSLHWFRGRYATALYEDGASPYEIAALMGHSSVQTTMRYIAVVDRRLVTAVGRLRPLPGLHFVDSRAAPAGRSVQVPVQSGAAPAS